MDAGTGGARGVAAVAIGDAGALGLTCDSARGATLFGVVGGAARISAIPDGVAGTVGALAEVAFAGASGPTTGLAFTAAGIDVATAAAGFSIVGSGS